MQKNFGELILPKDSILYSASKEPYLSIIRNILFHPYEYQISKRLYKITLKKNIRLYCDFEIIESHNYKFIVKSFLKSIITDYEKYKLFLIILKNNNFDGYIQPQYGRYEKLEIFLFDNKEIFDIENEEYIESWKNKNIIEYCGNYPICFIKYKAMMNINKRYEQDMTLYLEYVKNNSLLYSLFINSDIKYNEIEDNILDDLII